MDIGRTSDGFRDKNDILFSAPVLQKEGHEIVNNDEFACNDLHDSIDINRNSSVDCYRESYGKVVLEEPTLNGGGTNGGWEIIEKAAKRRDVEVITEEDSGVVDIGVKYEELSYYGGKSLDITARRSLKDLKDEIAPIEKDAKWGFDITTREFIIYAPRIEEKG